MGAILVFAMHAGFAFLEVGTVRHKNQVNALVKIIVDFGVSTVAYFFIGYMVAYGTDFLMSAAVLNGTEPMEGRDYGMSGYGLIKFFFLLTFAAAIPAIISGGIAERAKFWPQAIATAIIVGLILSPSTKAWSGVTRWASRPGWRMRSARRSTILPVLSWYTQSAAGSPWARL